jgi:carboxyl-terminal processing protease
MQPRLVVRSIVALAAAALHACSQPQSAATEPRTPISSEVALATFDETWTTVAVSDFDPSHGGVDWNEVRREFRPKAEHAASREDLRAVLQEMLDRLKRSHYGVIAAESAAALPEDAAPPTKSAPDHPRRAAEAEASFGLTLRWIEGQPVVTGVRADSPAQRAGVKVGWVACSIAGETVRPADAKDAGSMKKYFHDLVLQSADAGEDASEETWDFREPSGATAHVRMRRAPNQGISTKLGLLPPFQVHCDDRLLSPGELAALGLPRNLRIAVIDFNVWMPAVAQRLDEAFQRHLDADGVIIDLRGNPGGAGGMVMGVAGHVMDEPVSLGTMRTRDSSLEFKVNPRRSTSDGRRVEPFAGPVAIVIDPLSASTSEIFAGGLQKLDRARVFGRTSAGAALPAQMKSLPSGDAILYAFASFTLPDGSAIEGVGVIPDEATGSRLADWAAGRDADIDAAARWISAEKQG